MSAIKLTLGSLLNKVCSFLPYRWSLTPSISSSKRGLASAVFWILSCFLVASVFTSANVVHAFPVNQCPGDRFGADLGCSAGDVSITGMSVVGDATSCVGGTNITLDLQMTINFAVPDRWDIGIFISSDGKNPQIMAANGGASSCSVSVLPNSSPFLNLDGGATGDTCGDGNGTIGGGTGAGIHFMPNVTVPCQSLAGAAGSLYIPFVVSWDNLKTSTGDPACTSNADPVPNTKSKCNAPTVLQGSVAVVVLPNITKTDGKTNIFSGDSTSYTVTITNSTGASLSGAVFKDPAVSGIAVNSLSCSASGGATCPVSSTVAAMQGAGITIPAMPINSSVIFSIGATLTGSSGNTLSNTATVTVGSQSNTAIDTNTIVDSIIILPTTQSKTGDTGSTITYTYTLYNFGTSADTITLSAISSKGWAISLSPTSVSVPANGSTTVTLTVTIPGGASIGDVDSTTITAISGNNPSKKALATAVTTVTTVLTLTPNNTGSGGAGASVYYTHRVQNNASTSKSVSLIPVLTGACMGWTSALFASDKTTSLALPLTLAANGGFKDFVLKVSIPAGAAASSICTATLTAAYTTGAASSVSVTDVTTVKNIVLYKDPGYTTESYIYPAGNNVYAKGYGLASGTNYEYRWFNPAGTEVCTPRATSTTGAVFPDTCLIPTAGPLGTWTVQIWNTSTNALFVQSNFYVGPDHLKASYVGAAPAVNTDTIINLALHDRYNHVVPKDSLGNLVVGNPPTTGDPLMITVTVSGSAQIVSTTLTNAVITGQSVTGKLDNVNGTATLTIRDSIGESVTITPLSYKAVLYGSPVRDEPVTVVFIGSALHHLEIQHGSGSGVTCTSSTLTIKACSDNLSPCTAYTGGVSGTLSATGVAANWAGGTTFTIASGSSTVTKDIQLTTAGTTLIGATASPAAAASTTCNFGSPTCTYTAADAGFIVTAPDHVAETSSTLTIKAVKKSDSSLACAPGLTGSKSVNLKCSYTNPTNGTLPVRVGGVALNATASSSASCDSGGTNLTLTFDATGVATPALQYADVGKMSIDASFTGTAGTIDAGLSLIGNGSFIAAPASFAISAVSAGPIKAGNNFNATVTARNNAGNTTPNFGKETPTAEDVTLTFSKCQPTGTYAVNGIFSGNVGSFSNGVASSTNLNWSEVGKGDIVATLKSGSYLLSGLTATGNTGTSGTVCNTSGNVGAFIPDHFNTSVTNGCLGCGFTYSGQPFTVVISAMNGLGTPTTTVNYDGTANTTPNFAHDVTLTDANAATVGKFGVSSTPMGVTVNVAGDTLTVPKADFSKGVATLTSVPTYTFNTVPTIPTTVKIRAVDVVNTGVTSSGFTEGTVEIRSGRYKISNAYGSELLPLPMIATAQYYNSAGNWVTSTTDSATSFSTLASPAGNLVKSHLTGLLLSGDINVTGAGSVTFVSGVKSFTLAKPGKTGSVDIGLDGPSYLLPGVAGRATFGVYKGNNNYIYQRESY